MPKRRASSTWRQSAVKYRRGGYRPKYTGRRSRMYMSRRSGLVRRLGQEVNFVDNAAVAVEMNTTGTIGLVATIPQGAAQTQRIGRKIQLKSIQIRGVVGSDSTTTTASGSLFIVYDKRPDGTLPAITDILVSISSLSMTNSTNVGRFQIVKRMNWSFTGNNAGAGQQTDKTYYHVDKFVKISKRMVFKAAGTGAIGDIEQGALYYVSVGDTAAGTADGKGTIHFRTRFWDI